MPSKTKPTSETAAQIERRQRFDELMHWLYENGLRHYTTTVIDEGNVLKICSFAGQILMIQEITRSGQTSYEFFVPLDGGATWEETRAALAKRLATAR
jgi:hypothetical protein